MKHQFFRLPALFWILSLWSKGIVAKDTVISPTFISGEWSMDEDALILLSNNAFAEYILNNTGEEWDTFAISAYGYSESLSNPLKGEFRISINGIEYPHSDHEQDVVTIRHLDPATIHSVIISVPSPGIGVVVNNMTAFHSSSPMNIQKRRVEGRSDDEEDEDTTPDDDTTFVPSPPSTSTSNVPLSSIISSSNDYTRVSQPFTEVSPQRTASIGDTPSFLRQSTTVLSSTDPSPSTTASTSGATFFIPSIFASSVSAFLIALGFVFL